MTSQKILVVEDQENSRMALQSAISRVVPRYWQGFDRKKDVAYAASYESAQRALTQDSYTLVLLDHRMPLQDVGDLERRDFDAFSDCLQNVGYSLIPQIRESSPEAIIVGTSSLSSSETSGFPQPDFKMRKMYDDAEVDLDAILKRVVEMKGGGRK